MFAVHRLQVEERVHLLGHGVSKQKNACIHLETAFPGKRARASTWKRCFQTKERVHPLGNGVSRHSLDPIRFSRPVMGRFAVQPVQFEQPCRTYFASSPRSPGNSSRFARGSGNYREAGPSWNPQDHSRCREKPAIRRHRVSRGRKTESEGHRRHCSLFSIERHLAKVEVAVSNPVSRSSFQRLGIRNSRSYIKTTSLSA